MQIRINNICLYLFFRGKRMTLVYDRCDEDLDQLKAKKPFAFQNIKHVKVINENAFGHHHRSVIGNGPICVTYKYIIWTVTIVVKHIFSTF